jgi:hypothetical protein
MCRGVYSGDLGGMRRSVRRRKRRRRYCQRPFLSSIAMMVGREPGCVLFLVHTEAGQLVSEMFRLSSSLSLGL